MPKLELGRYIRWSLREADLVEPPIGIRRWLGAEFTLCIVGVDESVSIPM
jgi:hypothetical protein